MTISQLVTSAQYVVDERGRKKAVLLDFDVWQEILSRLEAQLLPDIENAAEDALWDEAFANSQDALAKLAAEALTERQAGRTHILEPDLL